MKDNPAFAGQKELFGHPIGLFILFLTEMWERFSYYGMRGLLIVYLTQHFLFSDERSSLLYGAYTALVFVMTIVGGVLADRYLGARKAVTFGAILLTLGHFGMSFEGDGSKQLLQYAGTEYQIILDARGGDARQMIVLDQAGSEASSYISFTDSSMDIAEPEGLGLPASIPRDQLTLSVVTQEGYLDILYLSLALIIAGVGFLKANISTIVGSLYGFGDARRCKGRQRDRWRDRRGNREVEDEHMRREGRKTQADKHRSHKEGDVDVGRHGRHSHAQKYGQEHGEEQRKELEANRVCRDIKRVEEPKHINSHKFCKTRKVKANVDDRHSHEH